MCVSISLTLRIILNIYYILFGKRVKLLFISFFSPDVPIVVLELGSKLNPNDIEEGDDVYFECVVRANPPAYKVVWEHNVSKHSLDPSCLLKVLLSL